MIFYNKIGFSKNNLISYKKLPQLIRKMQIIEKEILCTDNSEKKIKIAITFLKCSIFLVIK